MELSFLKLRHSGHNLHSISIVLELWGIGREFQPYKAGYDYKYVQQFFSFQ
jgi:hypothetical protein